MSLSIVVLTALFACGEEPAPAPAPEPAAKAVEPEPEPEPAAAAEAPNIVTVENGVAMVALEGTDTMRYNTNVIEVPAGSKVKLTLKHTGKLPAASMGHNFVLLAVGTDGAKFANAAITAKATDYIPAAMTGSVIANTGIVGGGEETTIEFDAPEAGEYPFVCSFPGHYAQMNGVFKVVAAE